MKRDPFTVRFDYTLQCPRDGSKQTVRFEVNPRPEEIFLKVVSCTAFLDPGERQCCQSCRLALAVHEYWLRPCLNAIIHSDP